MKISEYWQSLRKQIKARRDLVTMFGRAAIPGTQTIELFHYDLPMPLCVVWYQFSGLDCIQIDNSFVFEHVRRCGLRTMAHEQLLRAYPDHWFLSGAGTKSGAAWMRAVGYRQTSSGWEFRRKPVK